MMIRVGVVDDHPMVVGGLQAAFAIETDIALLGQASSVAEATALLQRDDLDVILLDVRLADGNALQCLAEREPRSSPAVLVLSTFDLPQYVAASIRFGARGFLPKTVPLAELLSAIRIVASGGSVYEPTQRDHAYVTLTPKEHEVLRLAIDGLSNKEIGARIGRSRKTVEGHLSDIFAKYGILGGRTELSIRAATEGWLEIQAPPRSRRGP
jgi:DNA-binding NarL/FixJ family response regulator